jgi:hypothetical protein
MNCAAWMLVATATFVTATATVTEAKPLKQGTKEEVRADFEMICNAVERSGASKSDPGEKAQKIADYLLSHIQTKQAMSFMQSMGGMLPQEKPAALKRAARESGYKGACPFADER